MKFLQRLVIVLAFFALVAPLFAYADAGAGLKAGLQGAASVSGLSSGCSGISCIVQTIGRVINAALGFLGVAFLVLMLYAGFLWMTAAGEDKQVTKAKDVIKSAIIGLIIIAFSYAISSFVLETLGSSTGSGTPAGGATERTVATPPVADTRPAGTRPTGVAPGLWCSCSCGRSEIFTSAADCNANCNRNCAAPHLVVRVAVQAPVPNPMVLLFYSR